MRTKNRNEEKNQPKLERIFAMRTIAMDDHHLPYVVHMKALTHMEEYGKRGRFPTLLLVMMFLMVGRGAKKRPEDTAGATCPHATTHAGLLVAACTAPPAILPYAILELRYWFAVL